ncbi:hypothetical protein [Microcystis phage MJing1]|nr:hypothetical protein [Microcystis phage MJing1]
MRETKWALIGLGSVLLYWLGADAGLYEFSAAGMLVAIGCGGCGAAVMLLAEG